MGVAPAKRIWARCLKATNKNKRRFRVSISLNMYDLPQVATLRWN
jgi:hypothetical protein